MFSADGEGREDASVLEGPPQAGHRPAAGRPGADVDAVQLDPTDVDGEHPGDEVQDSCLARPVGADQPQRLATTQVERDIVDGDDPAEVFGEAVGGEDDRLRRQWTGVATPGHGAADPRRGGRGAVAERSFEEDRSQKVAPGQELGGRPLEPDFALLHEIGAVCDGQRHVDRLLHQKDRASLGVDSPDDLQELLDDGRGQAQGQLVDDQQAGLGHECHAQAELLLLPAREVPRHGASVPSDVGTTPGPVACVRGPRRRLPWRTATPPL